MKDSGRLHNHLKVCCEAPGRIGSEKSSAVYLLCFHDDIVGYQYQQYFCKICPDLKKCSLHVIVYEGFVLFWMYSNNTKEQILRNR